MSSFWYLSVVCFVRLVDEVKARYSFVGWYRKPQLAPDALSSCHIMHFPKLICIKIFYKIFKKLSSSILVPKRRKSRLNKDYFVQVGAFLRAWVELVSSLWHLICGFINAFGIRKLNICRRGGVSEGNTQSLSQEAERKTEGAEVKEMKSSTFTVQWMQLKYADA